MGILTAEESYCPDASRDFICPVTSIDIEWGSSTFSDFCNPLCSWKSHCLDGSQDFIPKYRSICPNRYDLITYDVRNEPIGSHREGKFPGKQYSSTIVICGRLGIASIMLRYDRTSLAKGVFEELDDCWRKSNMTKSSTKG